MLVSSGDQVRQYDVIDPDINYSDHLPQFISLIYTSPVSTNQVRKHNLLTSPQLRWDRADLLSYYDFTRSKLEPLLASFNHLTSQLDVSESAYNNQFINQLHDDIAVLNEVTYQYVPHHRKNCYKFWWDHDMDLLKASSIDSNKVWKAAGIRRGTAPFLKIANLPGNYIDKNQRKSKPN